MQLLYLFKIRASIIRAVLSELVGHSTELPRLLAKLFKVITCSLEWAGHSTCSTKLFELPTKLTKLTSCSAELSKSLFRVVWDLHTLWQTFQVVHTSWQPLPAIGMIYDTQPFCRLLHLFVLIPELHTFTVHTFQTHFLQDAQLQFVHPIFLLFYSGC